MKYVRILCAVALVFALCSAFTMKDKPSYNLNSLKKKIFGEADSFRNPQGYG